jgi:hypothetical protein
MKNINYDQLLDELVNGARNILILGAAGHGKSHLIKKLCKLRSDILVTAPTGIAAMNIDGVTIDSLFGIVPYTSVKRNISGFKKSKIAMANILLIDEISMVKSITLDEVNDSLKAIRDNMQPFGGLRLILIGDLMQLEPVVPVYEIDGIKKKYPWFDGDAGFYNAQVFKEDNYMQNTFDYCYLRHNFRQNGDIMFQNILEDLRGGKMCPQTLNIINNQYNENVNYFDLYQNEYHFLTVTNKMASAINNSIIENISGEAYLLNTIKNYYQKPFYKMIRNNRNFYEITIKRGMKIMFVINDREGKCRWANGTIGYIEDIIYHNDTVLSVVIKIYKGGKQYVYNVERVKTDINGQYPNKEIDIVGHLYNFPFIPSFATTIDKVQGLTLNKAVIVLEEDVRPNQIYVALSRVNKLSNIIITGRKLMYSDIKTSEKFLGFYKSIESRMSNVYYIPANTIVNNVVNIYGNENNISLNQPISTGYIQEKTA